MITINEAKWGAEVVRRMFMNHLTFHGPLLKLEEDRSECDFCRWQAEFYDDRVNA